MSGPGKNLEGCNILLGVTGGVAAFKEVDVLFQHVPIFRNGRPDGTDYENLHI